MSVPRETHTATLLPNGKVLVFGGRSASGTYLSSAELYNPASGTWSATGSSGAPRAAHTATLLPSGRVLVIAGVYAGGNQPGAALYDPATGMWSLTAGTNRAACRATLLPSGKVLLSGGHIENDPNNYSRYSVIYDPGLGFVRPDWQPVVNQRPPLFLGERMGIGGSRFRGLSQASGGNTQDSSTSYPLVQLRSLGNEQTIWLPVDPIYEWSDTSFTTSPLPNFPLGPALVTVFVNGIPSDARYMTVSTLNAVSRKLHNGVPYEIALPFTGTQGIECRSGGATNSYQVVLKFSMPVNFTGASVYPSRGSAEVDGPPVKNSDSREVAVNLKNVSSPLRASVVLQGVSDATNPGNSFAQYDAVIPFNVLIGDVTANGTVTNTDVGAVKGQVNPTAPITQANFRNDVTVNGFVTNTDVGATKAQVNPTGGL
jgi:hypothetical protein